MTAERSRPRVHLAQDPRGARHLGPHHGAARGQEDRHRAPAEVTRRALVEMMVGRQLAPEGQPPGARTGRGEARGPRPRREGRQGHRGCAGAFARVCAGEIVGIAGVSGNGQRELAEAIAGIRAAPRAVPSDWATTSWPAQQAGGGRVPPVSAMCRRSASATVWSADFSVAENLMLVDSDNRYSPSRVSAPRCHPRPLPGARGDFDVRTPRIDTPTRNLSGGNIQKLILARELSGSPGAAGGAAHPGHRRRRRPLHPRPPRAKTRQRHCGAHHLRGPRRDHRDLRPGPGHVRGQDHRVGGPPASSPVRTSG